MSHLPNMSRLSLVVMDAEKADGPMPHRRCSNTGAIGENHELAIGAVALISSWIEGGLVVRSLDRGAGDGHSGRVSIVGHIDQTQLAASRVDWWTSFVDNIKQTVSAKGAYNTVSLVDTKGVGVPDEFWKSLYGENVAPPPDGVAIRRLHKDKVFKKGHAAGELFLACYCASRGLGPRVYAGFFEILRWETHTGPYPPDLFPRGPSQPGSSTPGPSQPFRDPLKAAEPMQQQQPSATKKRKTRGDGTFNRLPVKWNKDVGAKVTMALPLQHNYVKSFTMVLERWQLDADAFLKLLYEDPTTLKEQWVQDRTKQFTQKLWTLIRGTATYGIFHGDIKPNNILVRGVGVDIRTNIRNTAFEFSLCLTDFDPRFCAVVSPESIPIHAELQQCKRCLVSSMLALFMGFIKCWRPACWAQIHSYLPSVTPPVAGYTAPSIGAVCGFLANTKYIYELGYSTDRPEIMKLVDLGVGETPIETKYANKTLRDIGLIFQRVVGAYAGRGHHHRVSTQYPHCLKLVADRPLITQVIDYCILQPPNVV